MKTGVYFSRHSVAFILLLVISYSGLPAQYLSKVTWEGYFMHDLRTALKFSGSDEASTWFKRNPGVPDFEPLYHSMQPNPLYYAGRLYVFASGGCLSTIGHYF